MYFLESNVNSVLSFIYSVLMCRLQRSLESNGLDTMVSNLHKLCYGKDTLAYDMVEEFRAPFADSLCIRLFNKNILKETDFENREGGVFLTHNGNRKVIEEIENKLESKFFYAPLEKIVSFDQMIEHQVSLYKSVVLGEQAEYIPFRR